MSRINGVNVERARIPEYLDEYYFSCVQIWNRYKRFGFPFEGGWAEQPAYIVEVIECFDRLVEKQNDSRRTPHSNKSRH